MKTGPEIRDDIQAILDARPKKYLAERLAKYVVGIRNLALGFPKLDRKAGELNLPRHANLHLYDSRPHPKDFLSSSEGENMVVNFHRKNRIR